MSHKYILKKSLFEKTEHQNGMEQSQGCRKAAREEVDDDCEHLNLGVSYAGLSSCLATYSHVAPVPPTSLLSISSLSFE